MWWKRFLGSPFAVRALPREKLEHLVIISSEQIQKMKTHTRSLTSEVQDLQIETTRQLSLRPTADATEPESDEACPPHYSAAERRCVQLRHKIAQLTADMEKLDNEILRREDVLGQHLEMHQAQSPVPRDSLLIGPFNSTDLRKIYSELTLLAATVPNKNDRDDFSFCLDILSCESSLLGRRIEEMRQEFTQNCLMEQETLDGLLGEGQKLQANIRKLDDQMDQLWKNADHSRPVAPGTRRDLQNEIRQLSVTTTDLDGLNQEIESLTVKRDEYKARLGALSGELLARPTDESGRKADIEESLHLKQRRTNLEIQLHELEQAEVQNQSSLLGLRESIDECEAETAEIREQCTRIRGATDDQRWKVDKLKQAKVTVNDVKMILRIMRRFLPQELEKSIEELREHMELLKKRTGTMKRRLTQLTEQQGDYETQIAALQELLATGNSKLTDHR
jgi:chromosome segregation ATPase